MNALLNPNLAYLLVLVAVLLSMATVTFPKPVGLKIAASLFWLAALSELIVLEANFWALALAASSLVPFILAARQEQTHAPFLILSLLLLVLGAFCLFSDKDRQLLNPAGVAIASVVAARIVWALLWRGWWPTARPVNPFEGCVATARTQIHEFGWVILDEGLWMARSEAPIPAGSQVRIVRQEGMILLVKAIENLHP